jgi:uncharacterized protein YjbI with pentapeptide repeats
MADLRQADLSGADLSNVKLKGASVSGTPQLVICRSLEGATMPNGQKYENWLKSKGRAEDGGNNGPS